MVNTEYQHMKKKDFEKLKFWKDVDRYMGQGINPDGIQKVLSFNELNQMELSELYKKLESGFVSSFKKGFPGDAFDHLKAMYFTSKCFSKEVLESDRISLERCVEELEPAPFIEDVLFVDKGRIIDVEKCQKYFRRYAFLEIEDQKHPKVDKSLDKMLSFVYTSFILGHVENNEKYFSEATQIAKIIAYLLKTNGSSPYYCESEFKEISNFTLERLTSLT